MLLFPAQRFAMLSHEVSQKKNAAPVSISYLQALLRANPDDRNLRLNLAGQLAQAGKVHKAQLVLKPLSGSNNKEVMWLRLELAWPDFHVAKPGTPARKRRRDFLGVLLRAVEGESNISVPHLETLAQRWLAIGKPAHAAHVYQRLARVDSVRAYHWYSKAAHWWLAANNPERASTAWQAVLAATNDPAKPPKAALDALQTVRQSSNVSGLSLASRFIHANPNDPAFLNIGIKIAMAQNHLKQARAWSAKYVELKPDDRSALERDTQIALALNQLDHALVNLKKLIAKKPDDTGLVARMAQVQLWNGQTKAALANYEKLAKSLHSDHYDTRVIKLAQDTHDTHAILAALDRIRNRHPLDSKHRKLLGDVLNSEGRPDRAIHLYRRWVNSGSAPRHVWVRLAKLEKQTGDLKRARRTWEHIAHKFGRALDETRARAHLLLDQWRTKEALAELESLPHKPAADNTQAADYWNTIGRLAWNLGQKIKARKAYRQLFLTQRINQTGYLRLARAAAETGHVNLAMRVAQSDWQTNGDTKMIIAMLGEAQRLHRPDLTKHLLAMAGQHRKRFAGSADYWQYVGDYAFTQRNFATARQAYLKALSITPGNAGVRSALLYTLAKSDHLKMLRHYLTAWESNGTSDPQLWQAFAMAYSRLGKTRRALPWYKRAVHAQPKNYLLILQYADALQHDHRFELALRMRHYALMKLRPELMHDLKAHGRLPRDETKREARILSAQAKMLGPDEAREWLADALKGRQGKRLSAVDMEMLFSYYLSRRQPAYARYWLLAAERRRLSTKDWQKMTIALSRNNQVKMQNLLTRMSSDSTIGVSDRINALRHLDFHAKALTTALNHSHPGVPSSASAEALPRYAAKLYRRMPQNYGTHVAMHRISNLDITSESLFLYLSSERWTTHFKLGTRQFNTTRSDFDLHGLADERYGSLAISRRERRGLTKLKLGALETNAKSIFQANLDQQWKITNRLEGTLFAHYNQPANETGQLRVLGIRDRFGGSFDYKFTARDSATMTAAYSNFYSREGHNKLGDGFILDSSLAHYLVNGKTHSLRIRAFANTEHNRLAARLPASLAARLPRKATVGNVVPRRYTFVGAGISFSRGTPDKKYPLVSSPRYKLKVDTGYALPGDQLGVSARFEIGTRVLGSDELSLSLGVDETGSKTRQNSYSAEIEYRYFLGR